VRVTVGDEADSEEGGEGLEEVEEPLVRADVAVDGEQLSYSCAMRADVANLEEDSRRE
jgi:hypothetical protein